MPDLGFRTLLTELPRANRVLLVSDGRPDGDSLGSTTATLQWLKRDYPHLTLAAFCQEHTPPSLRCFEEIQTVKNDSAVFLEPWDLIILHDAGDLIHAGIEAHLPNTPAGYILVDIDHHTTNQRYGQINIVQTDACSTTQVLYRCFVENAIPISVGMANSLLGGLLTDTGAFSNSGTNSAALAMAASLIDSGARYQEILQSTLARQSLESIRLWGLAFRRLVKHPALDFAVTYLRYEDYASLSDEEAADGLSNILNTICGDVEAVLVLKESDDERIKGSFRSTKRDVSRICQAFGGGGHKRASGFAIPGKFVTRADGTIEIVAP